MTIELDGPDVDGPDVDGLAEVLAVLAEWQDDAAPLQLHPGDLGWYWRFGAEAVAAAVRTWRHDGRVVAIGLLDGERLLRVTVAPELRGDAEVARRIVADVIDPARGVLGAGAASVEAPADSPVEALLAEAGWACGGAWTPPRPAWACGPRGTAAGRPVRRPARCGSGWSPIPSATTPATSMSCSTTTRTQHST